MQQWHLLLAACVLLAICVVPSNPDDGSSVLFRNVPELYRQTIRRYENEIQHTRTLWVSALNSRAHGCEIEFWSNEILVYAAAIACIYKILHFHYHFIIYWMNSITNVKMLSILILSHMTSKLRTVPDSQSLNYNTCFIHNMYLYMYVCFFWHTAQAYLFMCVTLLSGTMTDAIRT
jgi:hypothetical protein